MQKKGVCAGEWTVNQFFRDHKGPCISGKSGCGSSRYGLLALNVYGLLWIAMGFYGLFPRGWKCHIRRPAFGQVFNVLNPTRGRMVDPEVSQRLFPAQKPVGSDVNSTQLRFQKRNWNENSPAFPQLSNNHFPPLTLTSTLHHQSCTARCARCHSVAISCAMAEKAAVAWLMVWATEVLWKWQYE